MQAGVWALVRGVEGLSKKRKKKEKTHGHRQQCGDCLGGVGGGKGWYGEINSDERR